MLCASFSFAMGSWNIVYNWSWPFQEKKSIRPSFSAERIFGGVLLAMCTNDFICFYDWAECRLIRRIDVNVKVTQFAASWIQTCYMHAIWNVIPSKRSVFFVVESLLGRQWWLSNNCKWHIILHIEV